MNFHFIITEEEFQFLLDAVSFIAKKGKYFLPGYRFDLSTGNWLPRDWHPVLPAFGIDDAFSAKSRETHLSDEEISACYRSYLEEAETLAETQRSVYESMTPNTTERNLIPFMYFP